MIYIDSSVLLADLLAEPRSPSEALWEEDLVSNQLLAYEVWNRINAYGLGITHGGRARGLLARVNLTEMGELALGRALEPFPVAVRTLDALHLATALRLAESGSMELTFLTHDAELAIAARSVNFAVEGI